MNMVRLHGVKTVHTHRFSSEVTMVVDVSGLLLEVELNPVVEPDEMVLSALSNKHMLKATRVKVPAIIRYMSSQTRSQIKAAFLWYQNIQLQINENLFYQLNCCENRPCRGIANT